MSSRSTECPTCRPRRAPPRTPLNQLIDAGLEPGERTDAFDDEVAAGAVISTDPAAGTEVAPGTTVDYVVSLGVEPTPTPEPTPAPVAVPDLRGLAAEDAVNQLLDAGLEPGERTEPSTTRSPPAPSSAPTGRRHRGRARHRRRLRRLPGRRAASTPVARPCRPGVRGSPEDAVNAALDAGLEPGERTDAFDDEVAAGAVISTDPAAGTEVAPGTTVDYVVSQGVEPTTPTDPSRPRHRWPSRTSVGSRRRTPSTRSSTPGLEPGERTDAFDDEVAAGSRHQHRSRRRHRGRAGHHRRLRRVPGCRADTDPRADPGTSGRAGPPRRARRGRRQPLLDAGLEPGERTDAFDDEVAAGAVISTDPAAGTEVAPGTTIDYSCRRVSSRHRPPSPPRAPSRCPTSAASPRDDAVNAAHRRRPRAR